MHHGIAPLARGIAKPPVNMVATTARHPDRTLRFPPYIVLADTCDSYWRGWRIGRDLAAGIDQHGLKLATPLRCLA